MSLAPARNPQATVLNALLEGRSLSSTQLVNQYRVTNYRKVISNLRSKGYVIYSNREASNGQVGRPRTSYRLGTPTKSMMATVFALFGAQAFSGR